MRGLAQFDGPIGDADRLVEMRANAFAIELLVPMYELIQENGTIVSGDDLRRLSESKHVSTHALIWHAENIRQLSMS
jgi:Zn-dependent peptidase ImmA (M78 family)